MKEEFFSPHQDYNRGPLEPKASVLPMSILIIYFIFFVINLSLSFCFFLFCFSFSWTFGAISFRWFFTSKSHRFGSRFSSVRETNPGLQKHSTSKTQKINNSRTQAIKNSQTQKLTTQVLKTINIIWQHSYFKNPGPHKHPTSFDNIVTSKKT